MVGLLDQVIFVVYLAILLVVGFVSTKIVVSAEEYMVAGRRLRLWLAFATVAATWIGGGITLGVAGRAYAGRVIGLWGVTLGFALSLFLVGLFYAGPLHKLRLTTLADVFEVRLGSRWASILASLVMFIAYIFAVTAQFIAGAKLVETVFGWNYLIALLVVGGVIVVYTVLGGLWSVALTDFIQFLLIVVGVPLALVLAIGRAGFESVLTRTTEVGLFDFGKILLAVDFWALLVVLGLGDVPAPDLMQRVFASDSEKTARRSAVLSGFAYILIGLFSALVGVAVYVISPGLKDPELALPTLITITLPTGIAGLVLSGVMAAIMSNADSMLLAPATLIAKNIVRDFLKPGMSDREMLTVSKVAVATLGFLAILVSIPRPDILYWLTLAFDVLFAALFFPLTLAIFWKGFTGAGAIAGISGGTISRLLLEALYNAGYIAEWWIPSIVGPIVSLVLCLTISLLVKRG